ncbi:MAG: serine/threonine-protein phosphatase [Desulfobacterales bacterium]|nr:serine/threonine-protein phosphatase [Desulfobacterales bacterium]
MVIVQSAGITDAGRKRKSNEDAMLLDDDGGLYVVADGVGGHRAGEVASRLVVDTIRGHMDSFKGSDAEESADFDGTLSIEANRLLSSIQVANRVVHQASNSKESLRGMGSTVSAVYFAADTFVAANVGDSPIYLVRDGTIELLCELHTVMAEQAAVDPHGIDRLGRNYRHMLTRAIGVEETVKACISEIQLFKGDIIVIGSDGLSDKVPSEEILDVVNKDRPDNACRSLVDLANERGGDDNATVIVLKVKALKQETGGILGLISRIIS